MISNGLNDKTNKQTNNYPVPFEKRKQFSSLKAYKNYELSTALYDFQSLIQVLCGFEQSERSKTL